MTAEVQRRNVRRAAVAIAPVAGAHRIVVAHGNGPQVGLLALQSEAYSQVDPYPLDVLGAETEGMIGYMIEQELGNVLPPETPLATLLTMIEVDPHDTAFERPEKFVGPTYDEAEARKVAETKHCFRARRRGGARGAVAQPRRIFELRPVRWLWIRA
jgi:carbamate kinase